ncbi:hypothetical protein SAY86_025512 [Trapa natans]|uniref:non-specific serine/threonine protein kinase n=1 Tax=Trapa natans TaxID=22666 RepID=A0AAN7RE57_TRANT|nr:hypothetical protein SAY86_025512 [Trapa natans]
MPMEVGNLVNLGVLDVSDNMLSGSIPVSIGGCTSMEQLYMAGNNFHGVIPSSIRSLKGLSALNLSRNNLSGEIPSFLGSLSLLEILNLSYNNFKGAVPVDGVFRNVTAVFLEGNSKLCGGFPGLHLPDCISEKANKRKTHHTMTLVVVSTISAILGVSLTALLVLLGLLRKKGRSQALNSVFLDRESFPTVSYHSLLKATDSFSEANLLGVGGFGSVYRGMIREDDAMMVFAVKVLNLSKRGAFKSFMAECEALRNIRHRNLVKVLTACSGIDGSGNDFKALVYDFMPNGSLEDWLHQTDPTGRFAGGGEGVCMRRKNLTLLQRLNIAIDTAWALDYLHRQCEKPIVHCDLKPSNILLDANMVAHVGDFGLARFILGPSNHVHAHESSSIVIRGSTGYVAPEYGMGSEVSESGDVYSYGIVLLEMFTGKRPTDEMFNEELNLHDFSKKALSGGLEEIADPMLLEEGWKAIYGSEEDLTSHGRGKTVECLVSIFQVGVACSNVQMKERMNIGEVAASLSSIKEKIMEDHNLHRS